MELPSVEGGPRPATSAHRGTLSSHPAFCGTLQPWRLLGAPQAWRIPDALEPSSAEELGQHVDALKEVEHGP